MEQEFRNENQEQAEGSAQPDFREEAETSHETAPRPPVQNQDGRREHCGRKHAWWKILLAAVLVAGLAFGGGYAGFALAGRNADRAVISNQTPAPEETKAPDKGNASIQAAAPAENGNTGSEATSVANKVVPSVVAITTEQMTTGNYWFGSQVTGGAGSGVILTADGYIVTNSHVINGADTITVELHDGTTYPATVKGVYYDSDLAVVKIEATGLTPVTFGDSDGVVQGETIYAVGNPEGSFSSSITQGIISALNRTIDVSLDVPQSQQSGEDQQQGEETDPFAGFGKKQQNNGNGQDNGGSQGNGNSQNNGGNMSNFGDLFGGFGQMFGFGNGSGGNVYGNIGNMKTVSLHVFQFDAAVSPGNSGGGLFNADGELIGIVCAKSSDTQAEGLSFAIQGNRVNRIASSLMTTGTYEPTEEEKQEMAEQNQPSVSTNKAVLGITVATLDASSAMEYGYTNAGVYVIEVTEESTKNAGVQVGDRIISADETMISTTTDLTGYLADKNPGEQVTLHMDRDGKMVSIPVTLLANTAAKEN